MTEADESNRIESRQIGIRGSGDGGHGHGHTQAAAASSDEKNDTTRHVTPAAPFTLRSGSSRAHPAHPGTPARHSHSLALRWPIPSPAHPPIRPPALYVPPSSAPRSLLRFQRTQLLHMTFPSLSPLANHFPPGSHPPICHLSITLLSTQIHTPHSPTLRSFPPTGGVYNPRYLYNALYPVSFSYVHAENPISLSSQTPIATP